MASALPPPGDFIFEPPKKSPAAGWYAVPIILGVLAAVVFVTGIVVFVRAFEGGFDRVDNPARISLPLDDSGVYSSFRDSGALCTLTDSAGSEIVLRSPAGTSSISIRDDHRYLIASVPDSLPAGTYVLSCPDAGPSLWLGPELSVARAFVGVALVFVAPGMLVVAAIVLLIIIVVKRNT